MPISQPLHNAVPSPQGTSCQYGLPAAAQPLPYWVDMQRTWNNIPAIWYFGGLWVALSLVSTGIGLSSLNIPLNENQVLYLFSTTGQVIAAVYGLTLTGFIFFRNELSREEFEDETLAEAVDALKNRYFVLLVFITALVIVTILLSNVAIANENTAGTFWNALIINTGQSAFVTSLLAVTYFIFDVISPRRIEKASQRLQEQVDPSRTEQTKGSLEEFLTNFNQIEALLAKYGIPYQRVPSSSFEKSSNRRISNVRLAEMLLRDDRINKSLFNRLRELITLRNSIIHGAEPLVSREAVSASATVLEQLRATLTEDRNVS